MRRVRDEELRAVGARAGVRHREDAGAVVLERRVELVAELVARAAGAGAGGVAALGHEALDDAVERDAVVVAVAGEEDEVVDGVRRLVGEQLDDDVAVVGADGRRVALARVDDHLRRCAVLLGHSVLLSRGTRGGR